MTTSNAQQTRAIISSFGLAERILFMLSKDPATAFRGGYEDGIGEQWDLANALSVLRQEFPDFDALIAGQRVLDYGCGDGFQSVAIAQAGAARVIGVDLEEARLEYGRKMAKNMDNVFFSKTVEEEVDVAISLNAFEHFPEPQKNLQELGLAVRPGGLILITFGPPWLAPYGAHMHFFTTFPWVNILFSERCVRRVRGLYRDDGDMCLRYGPPKMTLRLFEKLIEESGLRVERLDYRTVKNLPLSKIPVLRELFTNHVTCLLRRPVGAAG